ncbi:MAG: hypothetical protein DME05_25865, partial [Candidatus Rokuibacteriota bacterium]
MPAVREHGATGREHVAAPVGVGAVDEADDDAVARLFREDRRVVRTPGPTTHIVHDGERERSGDAKDDRVED